MKNLTKIIVFNTCTFITIFVLFELGVRIFTPQNLRVDPENSHIVFGNTFRPKPNFEAIVQRAERVVTWKINSKGLRDSEISYNKQTNEYRILGLGDSFTFGFHVEQQETFLHQLEIQLNNNVNLSDGLGARNFQTVNMGVGGYGLAASNYMLQEEGLKYDADMVVTAVFVGNDIIETFGEHAVNQAVTPPTNIGNSQPAAQTPFSWIYDSDNKPMSWKVKKFLGGHLHSYVFLTTRLNMLLVRYKLVKIEEATIDVLRINEPETIKLGWVQVRNYLTRIEALAKQNDLQHIVAIIPLRHQVNVQEWELIIQAYNLDPNDFELVRPQRILLDMLENEGINAIDLLPVLREEQDNTYYAKDPHFNPKGHEVTAQAISQFIEAQLVR